MNVTLDITFLEFTWYPASTSSSTAQGMLIQERCVILYTMKASYFEPDSLRRCLSTDTLPDSDSRRCSHQCSGELELLRIVSMRYYLHSTDTIYSLDDL